jgi:hypothetical protein
MTDDSLLDQIRKAASEHCSTATQKRLPLERCTAATRLDRPPDSVNDPFWADIPSVGHFFRERLHDGFDQSTRAVVACDSRALYVHFQCECVPARPRVVSQFYHSDSVELFLDPAHDHYHYLQLSICADGTCVGSRRTRPLDSQRWEHKGKVDERPLGKWVGEANISKSGWSALFTIPFETLEIDSALATTLGFNLGRQRCDGMWEYTIWNQTHSGPHAPWAFGQLALGTLPAVSVEQVDLGELHLWENWGELRIMNRAQQTADLTLEITVRSGANVEQLCFSDSVHAMLTKDDAGISVPFSFPFDPQDYRWQQLELKLSDNTRNIFWQARYLFGRGWPGWLLQIDDRREGPPAENPDASDPDFMAKKRTYIIRRLPRFLRKTTAQGAHSDFTLEASDGSVQFDLMKAGALQRIADYIYARYDTDVDRLLGATYFIHQTAVMTYANAPSELVSSLGALSILRFGSAQCCCSAAALVGLLEKMKCDASGRPYRGTRVGIPGHVTTVVEFQGKRVHLDPSVGRFYFLRDNCTLASMEELLAEPELARRAGAHLEEFHRTAAQSPGMPVFYRPDCGIWPPGAPAE